MASDHIMKIALISKLLRPSTMTLMRIEEVLTFSVQLFLVKIIENKVLTIEISLVD